MNKNCYNCRNRTLEFSDSYSYMESYKCLNSPVYKTVWDIKECGYVRKVDGHRRCRKVWNTDACVWKPTRMGIFKQTLKNIWQGCAGQTILDSGD